MSIRKLRSVAIALVFAGVGLLAPASPVHAGRLGFRGLDEVAGQVREHGVLQVLTRLLRHVVELSGGGMDPNGNH